MKKVITILLSFGTLILVAYFSISFYINSKFNDVKDKLIQNHPEIMNIEKINSIGGWGEWFSEYVLIVEINGSKFRVWATEEGKITDQEPL
ncbi:hypothetical protein ACOQFO_12560 [Ureibacillus sp. MALMAid1270]|uniref:hypothetical protein n=1 Tax=Ureibacillus sp. MALMAid1270 TaxID=3411629 RepID=UPI003BA5C040